MKIDSQVFSAMLVRGAGGVLSVVEIPALPLAKGRYFFGIKQVCEKAVGIAYDQNRLGAFYVINDKNALDYIPGYQMGYGSLVIRATFVPMPKKGEDSTSMNRPNAKEIRFNVYPNPANEMVNISLNESPTNTVRVSLVDLNGHLVSEVYAKSAVIQIPTAHLPIGTYIVFVYDGTVTRGARKILLTR